MFSNRSLLWLLWIFFVLSLWQISFSQAKRSSSSEQAPKTVVPGRSTFNSTCAPCHGLDGRGSDKAVNIGASARAQRLSDAELASIISNGVPESGMPAFHTLTAGQVRALVSYLRSLQGKGETHDVAGDAKRGREIFFGKGDCSTCHAVSGMGGFLGPDLTEYAATASAGGIRDEILRSPRVPAHGYREALITTAKGDRLQGLIRNEDNFSIQLQTKDGNFHLLRKTDVQNCQEVDGALMPANYRERLTDSELDDLVTYLMKTPNPNKAATPLKKKDDFE
jgi:putative heme-binding domain-containing protein